MSAIKSLQDLAKKVGIDIENNKHINLKVELPFDKEETILGFGYDVETDSMYISWDRCGYLLQDEMNECLAFEIVKHIQQTDLEMFDGIFTFPSYDNYSEFDYATFLGSMENLVEEVKTLVETAMSKKPLDDNAWRKAALAMNMIMNDVQYYNIFVEKNK